MARSNKERLKPNKDIVRRSSSKRNTYRAIVENAPEILALLGAAGLIIYVSPYTEKVLGYRNDELEGRDIFTFIHPEDASRAAQEYADTVQRGGERVPSVLRVRDSSGEWVPFEIIANNQLQHPDIQAVIFTARDLRFRKEIEVAVRRANADAEAAVAERVTELAKINAELRIENQARLQAESNLQHTISLLNATLDSTADGILVVSNNGKVTSCNKKFLEMWRIGCESRVKDNEALLAQVMAQLQDPTGFIERVRELQCDSDTTSFDVLHFKDGRIFERYSQPQLLGDQITGRVWSFRDVTRARNLELELRQSQKMEALGRLAGGIAHDFNNLLMLISGYANQLLENPALVEGHNTCSQILATSKRAASVTKQLLAFSRKQPDAPAVVDLNLVISNLEHMLRRLISDQIQLDISLSADPQPIFIDASQLEMLIMNLAINAQDAMPEGGELSIATSTMHVPSSESESGESTKTFTVLDVTDNGHGMTSEVQARIFEPFFTTKQLGRGTGLGLSTVLGIAERAGGHIEVHSEPEKGARFQVFLPQVETVPSISLNPPSTPPPGGGQETILLAEDESGIRTMTRAYLETLGYRVIEASDGTEAIRRSLEYSGPIHLVLTDFLMPGTRGDSAVKAIRIDRPTVKAIFVSGYADQDTVGTLENILYKPFELPELGRRIRSVLDSSSSSQLNPAA